MSRAGGGKALKLPLLPHRSGCGDPEELFCFFLPLLLILGSTEWRSFQSPPPSLGAAVCLHAPNLGFRGTPGAPPLCLPVVTRGPVRAPCSQLTQCCFSAVMEEQLSHGGGGGPAVSLSAPHGPTLGLFVPIWVRSGVGGNRSV